MNPTPADVLALHLLRGMPRTIGQLAEMLNWPRRTVEAAITELRLLGRPIASDGRGVWLSDSAKEMADQAQRLRERALHQLLTARAVRQTARRMAAAEFRQTTLWDAA